MRFDNAASLEQILWQSRLADLPRANDRLILQRLFGGEPPFDKDSAEENNIEINRNDLSGPNILSQARRQWNTAFLAQKNYFRVTLDSGPVHKRAEWASIITKLLNRRLKRNPRMRSQIRSVGANTMLYGIGPVNWRDRRTPIPDPIAVASLLVPSETDVDFENLDVFSVFREWTGVQLYDMTHGPKVDPGWNMRLVDSQLEWIKDQYMKQPNATAYQYMPERIEELYKQDKGFWGSDAVPTIDIWDTYFREQEDGKGWYRRITLDWGLNNEQAAQYTHTTPPSRNKYRDGTDDKYGFIYSSGKRKYANKLSEILHCQFADISPWAPFKYHAVRSPAWMLWGPCDLNSRLYCKTMEQAFLECLWLWRVPGQEAFNRIKMANFFHMGVVPNGITSFTDRYKPDPKIIETAFARNQQLMAQSSAAYTQMPNQERDRGKTATQFIGEMNMVNAMLEGVLVLAFDQEEAKIREICRRFCIRGNPDKDAREFRAAALKEGVPAEMLDSERWEIEMERPIGTGNKTIQMAQVQFLNSIREHMPPEGQRIIDHLSVFAGTDQPDLAEQIAPIAQQKDPSESMQEAQKLTERLMANLPVPLTSRMIVEDYVLAWIGDMTTIVEQRIQGGNMASMQDIAGLQNMSKTIKEYVGKLEQEDNPKAKEYLQALGNLDNHVKGFAQRLMEQMKKQAQGGGQNGELQAKIQGKVIEAKAKAQNMRESHALRTAQRQAQFELEQQREDKRLANDLRRKNLEAGLDIAHDVARKGVELEHNRMKSLSE